MIQSKENWWSAIIVMVAADSNHEKTKKNICATDDGSSWRTKLSKQFQRDFIGYNKKELMQEKVKTNFHL